MSQATAAERRLFTIKGDPQQKAWKYIHDSTSASSVDLNRTAIVNGARKYTYGSMFRQWERYASVFSALHMTGADNARVGMMGAVSAEAIFTFYGLNMVGAQVSILSSFSGLKVGRIKQVIREEHLTDFIITDDFAQPTLIQELLEQREALGLHNVLVLHLPVFGSGVNSMLAAMQETKYMYLKGWYAPVCMDTLLNVYGDHPVSYAEDAGSDTAVILHTSGTTGGVGKPVVLSDRALNAVGTTIASTAFSWIPQDELVCALSIDLSNAYGLVNQVHLPLSVGGTIAAVPGGALNPSFHQEIPAMKISILFCISAMFNYWMKLPESTAFDFSSLRCVIIGGTAVSAAEKRRFYEFLRAHGCGEIPLINGYGISELAGACCLSTPDLDDESIGYALPGVSVRLLDEETGKFLTEKDAPCSGVLYLSSPSIAGDRLDGKEICKIELINKKPYICTNDAVSMDATGKLTFLGRANRYFINDSGMKYESGRVETEFARQDGIESCCVVPVYVKTKHDNVPMLCVSTLAKAEAGKEVVREALLRVFTVDKTLPAEYIPYRILIAAELPRNANGKVDLYRIQQGQVSGECFDVKTVRRKECITNFRLESVEDGPDDMIKEVFQGIAADLKDSLPIKQTPSEANSAKNPFAAWNAMSYMGNQMVNMMAMPGMMNQPQWNWQNANRFSVPQPWMSSPQQMNQTMAYINQLSGMAWQAAQQMYTQYFRMLGQLWQMLQKGMPNQAAGKQGSAAANGPVK